VNITFVASECVPYSKTGGLADVVGALPRALAALGHKLTVFTPRYRQTKLQDAKVLLRSVTIPFDDQYRFCSVLDGGKHDGVQFYFIEYPPFFDRDGLYGHPASGDYPDNAERFALFCRAVLETSKLLGTPDIFHCHDWQTALIPVLMRSNYMGDWLFQKTPVVFTIHNIGYQGMFSEDVLPLLGLPWELFSMNRLEFFGRVNFLKGGIVFSDFVTTVSRRYSQEIQTSEYGFGLDGVIRARAGTVAGILNGVDYNEWSPATDKHIAKNYSPQDLSGKKLCKQDLLREFGLSDADPRLPVVGIVSRFATQKGFDLIAEVAERLAREPLLLVVLGSGERQFEDLFRRMAEVFPNKFAVRVKYDNALAHKVEAGADMFLMPSHYEPCGLNQIYSLKYGTVPIVRATGGLDDTIEHWNGDTQTGTGFKFYDYHGEALLGALREALHHYHANPDGWQKLMRNGMARDYSWGASAHDYVKVYERVKQFRS
jgi:starch synthase